MTKHHARLPLSAALLAGLLAATPLTSCGDPDWQAAQGQFAEAADHLEQAGSHLKDLTVRKASDWKSALGDSMDKLKASATVAKAGASQKALAAWDAVEDKRVAFQAKLAELESAGSAAGAELGEGVQAAYAELVAAVQAAKATMEEEKH